MNRNASEPMSRIHLSREVRQGEFITVVLTLTVAAVMRFFGLGLVQLLLLACAIFAQVIVGAMLVRVLAHGRVLPAVALVPLWFGAGSLAISVATLICASLGDGMRGALPIALRLLSVGVPAAYLLVALRTRSREIIKFDLPCSVTSFWLLIASLLALQAAIDWRLILVAGPALAGALTGRGLRKFGVSAFVTAVATFVVFVGGMAMIRAVLARTRIKLIPLEFALGSVDVNLWVGAAWSLLRHGPFEDVQKTGTMSGYHVLSAAWVSATAQMSSISVYVITSYLVYVVFGALFVGSVAVLIHRRGAMTYMQSIVVSLMLAMSSLSAIELKSPLSPESLTQYVAISWFATMLVLVSQMRVVKVAHSRFLLAGMGFGWIYFAKVSILMAVFAVVGTGIVMANVRDERAKLALFLGGFALIAAAVHLLWLYPARDDAVFGEVSLAFNIGGRWMNFLSDSTFGPVAQVASLVLALLFLGVCAIGAAVCRSRDRESLAMSVAGAISLLLATFIQFGTIGNGESYVWAYGTFFLGLGLALQVRPRSGIRVRSAGFVVPVIAGLIAGGLSGIGFWLLRISGDTSIAVGATALLSLAMLVVVCGVWRSRGRFQSATPAPLVDRIQAAWVAAALMVIAASAAQHASYSVREPVSIVREFAGQKDLSFDLLAMLTRSRIENRVESSFISRYECLRKQTPSDAIFAVDGIPSTEVIGLSERRLYFDPTSTASFRVGTAIRAEYDRRVQLVHDAVRNGNQHAVKKLRSDGVQYILVRAEIVGASEHLGRQESGVCSSEDLFVWEL